MAILGVALPPDTVTLNNSVEYLPMHYLPNPCLKKDGKTKARTIMRTASYCNHLARTASKKLYNYVSHEVPVLATSGHP